MLVDVFPVKRLPRSVGPLTYSVTDTTERPAALQPGTWVRVPFRRKSTDAIVYRAVRSSRLARERILPVSEILPFQPLRRTQLRLVEWFAATYAVSPSLALYSLLPARPRSAHRAPLPTPSVSDERLTVTVTIQQQFGTHLDTILHGKAIQSFLPVQTKAASALIWILLAGKVQNKQLLIVVPTLFRLRQLASVLAKRFPDRVFALDTELPIAEYWGRWHGVAKSNNAIIVTTRRGLLAPFHNLAWVGVDTETDQSHKQEEQNPHYDARALAAALARVHEARMLCTDAVPSLALTEQQAFFIEKTQTRRRNIVNMTHEHASGNRSPLADETVRHCAKTKGPVLFFLNRKGNARVLRCMDCSWTFTCPSCNAAFVLHAQIAYHCHRCRTTANAPLTCPSCSGTSLKYFGVGTEKVEQLLRKTFPERIVTRIDAESKKLPPTSDLVVATEQILTTGSVPDFATIVFVNVDQLFHIPDFRAKERALYLAERLIRLCLPSGDVMLQTYSPDDDVVQALARGSYAAFYQQERLLRAQLHLPPAFRLFKLIGKGQPSERMREGNELAKRLRMMFPHDGAYIEGPFDGVRRGSVGMILRLLPGSGQLATLQQFLQTLPDHWLLDPDPESLLV